MKYPCKECEYAATKVSALNIRSKHEGVKYTCDHCEYAATASGNLKKHIEIKYKGLRYKCVTTVNMLPPHLVVYRIMLVYLGLIHHCDQCAYSATEAGSLKRHIEKLHKGVRYPCTQCEYPAREACSLRKQI